MTFTDLSPRCGGSGAAQSRRTGGLLNALCVTAGALCALALPASSGATPKPPSSICVNSSDCTSTAAKEQGAGQTGVKWNPGHYMLPFLSDSWRDKQTTRFGYYDQIGDNPNVEGATIYVAWKELESSRGDYSAGIAYLRSEIDYLKNLRDPKRLWIRLTPQSYGSDTSRACSGSSRYYPKYVVDMGGCAVNRHHTVAALWKRDVADAYIGLIRAIGEAFDDEPYLEGVTLIRETAMGTDMGKGFSWGEYDKQVRRVAAAARDAFPKTNVVVNVNYMENQGRVNKFIDYLRSIGVGVGGPDVAPACVNDDCSRGYADPQGIWSYNTIKGNSAGGGVDIGKSVPIAFSVESSELGYDSVGKKGGYTAQEIFNFADKYLRATHLFWARNNATGTSRQQWSSGILPTIDSSRLSNTGCPTGYDSCSSD